MALTIGVSRYFLLLAIDVQGVESGLKEKRRRDIREEIILKEIYFERLWSVDLVLKWRAKLAELY